MGVLKPGDIPWHFPNRSVPSDSMFSIWACWLNALDVLQIKALDPCLHLNSGTTPSASIPQQICEEMKEAINGCGIQSTL